MAHPEWTDVPVRDTFLDYFSKRGHTVVPLSSAVPHNKPPTLSAYVPEVKINHLGNVGKDSYHPTFSELLVGGYFKKEVIKWPRELLTKIFGLDSTTPYVAYFKCNPDMDLDPDLEAKELWKSVGVSDETAGSVDNATLLNNDQIFHKASLVSRFDIDTGTGYVSAKSSSTSFE
ncbi:hypothetical protein F5Y12DRAFT_714547 [Xylaria sp. FL1777]|nr:hypothetical protein F5Y12DRAFT_714547 [Xylaria sp. FL1777]